MPLNLFNSKIYPWKQWTPRWVQSGDDLAGINYEEMIPDTSSNYPPKPMFNYQEVVCRDMPVDALVLNTICWLCCLHRSLSRSCSSGQQGAACFLKTTKRKRRCQRKKVFFSVHSIMFGVWVDSTLISCHISPHSHCGLSVLTHWVVGMMWYPNGMKEVERG